MTSDRRPGIIKGWCNRCGAGRPKYQSRKRLLSSGVPVLFCRPCRKYICKACWMEHTMEPHHISRSTPEPVKPFRDPGPLRLL